MNRRQARVGVDLFTGLVVASVGVALAGLTWRLAGATGTMPVAAATSTAASAPVEIGGFLSLAPFGTAEAASDAASDGSLHLKGILLAVPAAQSAALIAGPDGKVASYGVGAALGGGVVAAIEASQVIVRTPRGLQAIGFPPPASARPAAPPASAGTGAGFLPVGAAAPALPAASAGYRVGSSAPPALLAAGLQPGDIVEQLNGAPVSAAMSPDTVQRDLGNALLRGSAQVVVLRGGNRVSLRLAIH